MSNFWSKALGAPSAPAPQAPVSTTTSRPWWQQLTPPTSTPAQTQQVVQVPSGSPAYLPHQAHSAKLTETCPSCGSGNYCRGDRPLDMTHCYDCGYNPRFDQQAFAAQSGAATTATRQAEGAHLGYNGSVVAHIK